MGKLPRSIVYILVGGMLCLTGCAKTTRNPEEVVSKLSESDAESLNVQQARFEKSEDPPIAAETRYAAGQLAESQGKPAAAIGQYRAALQVDPHHQPSLYRLGVLNVQLGAYAEALVAWKSYVQATQEDATAWANLGFCHELAGNASEAELAYKRGIAKDAKSNPCRVNYGLMLARAGRTTEAIVHLQAVLSEAQVHYNLGSVYEQQGDREQAKAAYRQAMKLDPNLIEAQSRLATLD